MSRIYFCLLCHTELNWWDNKADGLEIGIPAMLKLLERVEEKTGRKVRVTWGAGTYHFKEKKELPPVFESHKALFKKLWEREDEIALHTHGYPDKDNIYRTDQFIASDTERLIKAGFPKSKTYIGGMWAFYPETLRIIEKLGFEVDCTIAGGRLEQDGVVLYDYPPSELLDKADWRRPYRISYENVVQAGSSGVIEVPISGHLIEFERNKNEELVWPFFEYYITERFKKRWERRKETGVDIFEVFWHPYEAILKEKPIQVNKLVLKRLEEFLLDIANWEDVSFSTVYEAAMNWRKVAGTPVACTSPNSG